MAEPGSFTERVKQQADIVRVVGEYLRLKKAGQNFIGLCPFHQEKTPSFAVHPIKQIYHCFGCGAGGDVFKFVMEMDKCPFPEAVRTVAEKCGIPIPRQRPRTPEEREASQQRATLLEIHSQASSFFVRQLESTAEGKAAGAYLEDRGLDRETIKRFALGYAPSAGDALVRFLQKDRGFSPKLLQLSGLFSKDERDALYDRFRRRIVFPIANESGKVVAFGARSLGDEMPKYLNSPETPIYTKSHLLYHLDRAKETIRRKEFAVLVEGYMDTIAVSRAGIENVVASCGTSLAEPQVKLLGRFTRTVVINYDPDSAGQIATERSISLLLERDFQVRVLALPKSNGKNADPDLFIRERGAEAYRKLLEEAPAFVDFLIARAKLMELATAEGKLRAVNFLMPYVQRIPNQLVRSEWATRIASQLRIDEPVLREALRRAAKDKRGEVKPKPELMGSTVRLAERRLLQMLIEAQGFRARLARQIRDNGLHAGLATETIFGALLDVAASDEQPDPVALEGKLEEKDRRLLYEIAFEQGAEGSWEEAESCLAALKRGRLEAELLTVQRQIEAQPVPEELRRLLGRKQELRTLLSEL